MVKQEKLSLVRVGYLMLFGVAFGFVEAAVVYYIRHIPGLFHSYNALDYKTLINLGFISFVKPLEPTLINTSVTHVETAREIATIIMLVSIAMVAGKNLRQRLGAFLVAFACWDIAYYVFLKMLIGWPNSWGSKDIYFLVPVVWIGPIITPIVISLCMLIVGARIYVLPKKTKPSHKAGQVT